jgi:hypothetical protein
MSKMADLSNECLVALGNLIIAFNDVEMFLRYFIGSLLKISMTQTEIVTYYLHWNALLTCLYALYEKSVTKPKLQKELYTVLNELKHCGERRNEFIHAEWTFGSTDEDVPIFRKLHIERKFKQQPPPEDPEKAPLRWVHPDKINLLTNELRKHEYRLRDIQTKFRCFQNMNPRPEFLVEWSPV